MSLGVSGGTYRLWLSEIGNIQKGNRGSEFSPNLPCGDNPAILRAGP